MAKIDLLVEDFLAQKKIAVVGVSDRRETGCNLAYRRFKGAGYEVTAVNPRLAEFEGDPCYPDLRSIPERPEAVFILKKCREKGITVIPGSCPNQFLNADFGHSMMRVLWRTLGFLKISQDQATGPST
jgi:predicted CoA-binding protein